jgi:transcriptional regulator with XRE-family HTH domain
MLNKKKSDKKGRADHVDQLVSKKLKMRRISLGLNQQQLGVAAGVSIQQIQKYEKATNRISGGKLYTFSKFLKVPISYFFEIPEEDSPVINQIFAAEDSEEYKSDDDLIITEKEVIALIRAYGEIKSSVVRKKVLDLIKSMS